MGWAQVRIYGIDLELNRQGLLLSLAGKTIKAHGVHLLFNFFLKFKYCEQSPQFKKKWNYVKFIFSKKATKKFKNLYPRFDVYLVSVKSTVKISQFLVVLLENMNFT